MATPLQILLIIISISTTATASAVSLSPSQFQNCRLHKSSPQFSTILSTLGFQELSTTATTTSLSSTTTNTVTIFAPTDSSLSTCPTCSLSLLLLEHSIQGLYPLSLLQNLAFGTKIETLATTHRCLTITNSLSKATNTTKIFVNGVEITQPDLYNDGFVIVHGIQGFLSHLSPSSCHVERMTSLSFPPPLLTSATPFFIMRRLLKDAMLRLRISGYTLLSLAMKEKYTDLIDLNAMTIFALNDDLLFDGGHVYVSDLRLHIVPNRRLMAVDLVDLPVGTEFPTMELGRNLVVTVAGGGGLLAPMRINHVKITSPDLVYNDRIVVHGVSGPFPRVHQMKSGYWPDQTLVEGPTAMVDIG